MNIFRGFTLIELLVVLSIAGILATFVGPVAYQQYLNVQRDGEIEKLKQAVSQTQFYALNQRRWVQMALNGNRVTLVSEVDNITYQFEFLRFDEQTISVNPNGFFQQDQLTYSIDEDPYTLPIGRDLYEQN